MIRNASGAAKINSAAFRVGRRRQIWYKKSRLTDVKKRGFFSVMPRLPRVVAILPRLSPSAWIHVVKPLTALHEAGRLRAWITLESLASPCNIHWADVALFSRNVSPHRAGLLHTALRCGVPVLYDLDDNFFELPPDSVAGRACAQPRHLATLTEYLSSASLVRVYSRPLLNRAAQLNHNVEMVASAIDLAQIRSPDAASTGPIKLVYATSRLDDSLAEIFLPALRQLSDDAGPRIEIHFWGPRPPDGSPGVRHHAAIHNYDRYLRQFSAAGFDIGLAPLADDVFHRSKTNTKFREYGACRVAGIYSAVEVYSDCVRDGQTGLLVPNTTADWYRAMRRLVDDADLRHAIQQQARAAVEERYSQQRFEAVLLEQIERLATDRPSKRALVVPASAGTPSEFRLKPVLQAPAAFLVQAIAHLRRNGLARGWNTLRWLVSSGRTLARLQWRLRRPCTTLKGANLSEFEYWEPEFSEEELRSQE